MSLDNILQVEPLVFMPTGNTYFISVPRLEMNGQSIKQVMMVDATVNIKVRVKGMCNYICMCYLYTVIITSSWLVIIIMLTRTSSRMASLSMQVISLMRLYCLSLPQMLMSNLWLNVHILLN